MEYEYYWLNGFLSFRTERDEKEERFLANVRFLSVSPQKQPKVSKKSMLTYLTIYVNLLDDLS